MISPEDEERIGKEIAINSNTTLLMLRSIKLDENARATIKRDKTIQILLGCIAMALNTANQLALCNSERSQIVLPS
jgi:hypothetical protein